MQVGVRGRERAATSETKVCKLGVRESEQAESIYRHTHTRSLAFFAHTNKISDNDENSAAVVLCLYGMRNC